MSKLTDEEFNRRIKQLEELGLAAEEAARALRDAWVAVSRREQPEYAADDLPGQQQ